MGYISNIEPASYLAGQIVDSNPYAIVSLKNVNPSLSIPFGIAMIFDGTLHGYNLPNSSGTITNRMAINTIAQRAPGYATVSGVVQITDVNATPVGVFASGLTLGYIAVVVEEAVVEGDPCFIRFAAGSDPSWTQRGAFRKSADVVSSAATAAVHPTWFFISAASANGFALVSSK